MRCFERLLGLPYASTIDQRYVQCPKLRLKQRNDFAAIFKLATATVGNQELHKFVHRAEIRGVVNLALMTGRGQHTCPFEDGEMPRQRRGLRTQLARNLQGGQALGPHADQQSESFQSGRLGKGRKSVDSVSLIHNSVLPEISNLDKVAALT